MLLQSLTPSDTTRPSTPVPGASRRLRVLTPLLTAFNAARLVCYLPTIWAVAQSGRSDQHSLLTWVTWLGANATLAAWSYERNGGKADTVVLISTANALMCLLTVGVITWHRF